jgi:aquaporin Z
VNTEEGEFKMGQETDKATTQELVKEVQINPFKKYAAELIGTMVLVLMGCGSVVLAGSFVGNLGIAFAFGLAVLAMVYAIGSISGCHINPAISISMLIAGKISVKDTAFYIAFQCFGAVIGAGLLYAIASGNPSYKLLVNGLGANQYQSYSLASVFIAEVVLTFIFLLVVHGATHERAPKGFAGVAIGLTLVLIHIVAIPLDGTSVNPARSLGPAIFVGGTALSQLWVFFVAPIIGGILAALVWKIFK